MSAIPFPLDPLASPDNSWFTLTVKPGVLMDQMMYSFYPYWDTEDGYCHVEWGDGTSTDVTASGSYVNHIYQTAGTYTLRIRANCYQVTFADQNNPAIYRLIYDTNGNWDALGNLTDCNYMFSGCESMVATIHSLPKSISNARAMFQNCTLITIDLNELAANAPAEGWTALGSIDSMFYNAGSDNSPGTVTGSQSAFLAKTPNTVPSMYTFRGTNTTE